MTPRLRKLLLTAHITFSVGWLGAVAGFLALAVTGLTSHDAPMARAAYLAMEVTGWFVIVPLSFAALLTGLVQSLGTEWGLFRHYWILVKFLLTILATIALLLHQFTAVAVAAKRVSEAAPGTLPEVDRLGTQLVGDAGLALLLLLAITALSVFKPWGRTRYGRRKQRERRESAISLSPFATASRHESPQMPGGTPLHAPRAFPHPDSDATAEGLPLRLKIFLAVVGVVVIVGGFVMLHLTGGGLGGH